MDNYGLESVEFFQKSFAFGSLFIFSDENGDNKVVCEVKIVNDGLGEVSFVPLGDDVISFKEGDIVTAINEASNISFSTDVSKNHGGRWVTLKIPEIVRLVNLRQSKRITVAESVKANEMKIASFGDDGNKKLMDHVGEVLDISETGASFKIKARRLDGYYKGESVEIKVSEKFAYLARLPGIVVHKTLCNMQSKDNRSYLIGIRFKKKIDLSPIVFD